MKIDRSILQANNQEIGDFGDPNKLESSISHVADIVDANDNGFVAHKTTTELDHPDKSVTEKKLADSSVSSRTVQAGAIGTRELDPALFQQPTTVQGVQTKFQSIDEQLTDIAVNIESFPLQIPELDDSARFTRALNSLPSNGGTLFIPQGKIYTGTFLFNRSNVRLTGGGTLKGSINLYGVDTTGIDRFSGTGDVSIENITIDGERVRNGINNKWFFGVDIHNVTFKNCLKAIYFEPIAKGQHCSRYNISMNRFIDCNYGLYIDYAQPQAPEMPFVVGDITFNDNQYEARTNDLGNIYHIWGKGLDGLICKGNTFFFGHKGTEQSNIYLEIFNWVHLEGNQLFEPKAHGIHCVNGSNLFIKENHVAWSGLEAIFLDNISTGIVSGNNCVWKDDNSVFANKTGILIQNSPFFIGNLIGNTFYFPNEYAIRIIASSYINITGNMARNKYSTNEPIKIESLSTCGDINIQGNQFTGYSKKMKTILSGKPTASTIHYNGNDEGVAGTILNGVVSPTFKSYTGNQTIIDISDSSLIVFGNTLATNITSITSEDLSTAMTRFIEMYSYNANTSISRTIPNVVIKGTGASVTIPAGESIKFMLYGGTLREMSRSFAVS